MRKKVMVLVLFVSVLLSFLIQTASASNESIQIESVNRTIHITYHKVIRVTDEYVFLNTGSDPFSSIVIEVPYQFDSNIASFEIYGNDSVEFSFNKLPYDGSGFSKWRIYLNKPLNSGDTVHVKNRINFIGLVSDYGNTPIEGKYGHINFNFVKFPSAPYYIQSCSVIITCDDGVTVYDSTDTTYKTNLVLADAISLQKNNLTSYSTRYNLSEPASPNYALSAIRFPNIKREIRIDTWGYMHVWEEHLVENYGPYGNFRVTRFVFNVPTDAENIYIYDKFGRLSFGIQEDTTKNISIDLDASRYTLQRGENTIYWVTYRIPLTNYVQRTGDKMRLNFDILFGTFHCIVENFDIQVILPKGSSLNYVLPSVDSTVISDRNVVLIFNETDVTAYNSQLIELEIDLSKSYIDMLSRPLIFIMIFGVVCSAYVVGKRVIPSKERSPQRATVVPAPILLEFCSLIEEKVSLISEIDKLEDDLKKRKIKKRIYRNQRKTQERKILELDKDINELKIHLKVAGGRFEQIVNELEINEAERQSAKDGIFNLEQRYIRKKISTVAYQKLFKDLLNRHKKARTKIDKLIFELREILT